ncbi:MAG TPA: FKBP-type peptidyl-prolyl cis-trans isomerase [Gemmatimonadaceae bacterium]|nr:FKBP-type peptidyl-prolyl cis-trans isomerase [Gemmatimonadaceae bacterium]
MRRLLILASTLALAACLDVPTVADNPTDPSTEAFAANLGVDIPNMTKTALGDYFKDLAVGDGAALGAPASVFITYQGFLKNGALFGQQSDTPINLSIDGPVGLRDGMIGMRVHGQRLIVIPSELGYGVNGNAGIPPNSTLVFIVQLESITE